MRARFNRHRGHRVHREIPPYVADEAAIASDGLLQIEKDVSFLQACVTSY